MSMVSPAVTIIQLAPDDLQAMLDRAVARAIEQAARTSGELWGVAELADHYRCSTRTIRRRELAGDLPARSGESWIRADVLQWDKDRRAHKSPGPTAQPA